MNFNKDETYLFVALLNIISNNCIIILTETIA